MLLWLQWEGPLFLKPWKLYCQIDIDLQNITIVAVAAVWRPPASESKEIIMQNRCRFTRCPDLLLWLQYGGLWRLKPLKL